MCTLVVFEGLWEIINLQSVVFSDFGPLPLAYLKLQFNQILLPNSTIVIATSTAIKATTTTTTATTTKGTTATTTTGTTATTTATTKIVATTKTTIATNTTTNIATTILPNARLVVYDYMPTRANSTTVLEPVVDQIVEVVEVDLQVANLFDATMIQVILHLVGCDNFHLYHD